GATGKMYRAVAFGILRDRVPQQEGPALRAYLAPLAIRVADGSVWLNGEDVTAAVQTQEVAQATSDLTTLPAVREKVTPLQRREAAAGGVVLEGRDTGTVVCPDAEVKFYLDASLDIRARRRHAELTRGGVSMTLDAVRKEIETRDEQDMTRAIAPRRRAAE